MNKKIIIIPMVAVIAIFLISFSITFDADQIPEGFTDMEKTNILFHVTLADPESLY